MTQRPLNWPTLPAPNRIRYDAENEAQFRTTIERILRSLATGTLQGDPAGVGTAGSLAKWGANGVLGGSNVFEDVTGLRVAESLTVQRALNVTGISTLSGAVNVGGKLTVTNDVAITGKLYSGSAPSTVSASAINLTYADALASNKKDGSGNINLVRTESDGFGGDNIVVLGGLNAGGVALEAADGYKWRMFGVPWDLIPWHNYPSNNNQQSIGGPGTALKSIYLATSVITPLVDTAAATDLVLSRNSSARLTLGASLVTSAVSFQATGGVTASNGGLVATGTTGSNGTATLDQYVVTKLDTDLGGLVHHWLTQTNGTIRIGLGLIGTASGSNVGGDFAIFGYNDAGTFLNTWFRLTRATGALTLLSTVSATQYISTITTGTAPLVVASTTVVANLHAANSDQLGGVNAASYALLASPTFTGVPAAPTAAPGTNTTQLATTAFVQAATSALVTGVSSVFGRVGAVVAVAGDYGPTLGGTGQTSWILGDLLYGSGVNTLAKLAGQTTSAKQYLSQTGTGTISAAPAWSAISAADVNPGTFGGSGDYVVPANFSAETSIYQGIDAVAYATHFGGGTTGGIFETLVRALGIGSAGSLSAGMIGGSLVSPTVITAGTKFGAFNFVGTDRASVPSHLATPISINVYAAENFVFGGAHGAYLRIATTAIGGSSATESWQFDTTGALFPVTAVTKTIDVGVRSTNVVRNMYAMRYYAQGTALVVGDYVLSAGWGTSPTKAVTGTDMGGRISITAKATTSANPTVTLTFHDGTFTNIPAIAYCGGDTTGPAVGAWVMTTPSATAPVFTWIGTPTANHVYVLDWVVMPS